MIMALLLLLISLIMAAVGFIACLGTGNVGTGFLGAACYLAILTRIEQAQRIAKDQKAATQE